uniref:Uncharacterized protein n=1 Tax=Anguilla anguilla TaxID=7936 RepID=A0A0E9XZV1_ANGAN
MQPCACGSVTPPRLTQRPLVLYEKNGFKQVYSNF